MVARVGTRASLSTPLTSALSQPASSGAPYIIQSSATTCQRRAATYLRRPRRPYTFTQLVTLSDGSMYQHRTTSPIPVYQSIKDARNARLWNPSSEKLLNVESDETGRLRAFRERFGRGWDARDGKSAEVAQEGDEAGTETTVDSRSLHGSYEIGEEEQGGLLDLISEYATVDAKEQAKQEGQAAASKITTSKKGKR